MDHQHDNGGDYVDQQYETGGALDGPYPDGPNHSSDTTPVPEQLVERDYAMDGLIDSMNRMRAGPGDHPEDRTGGVDEQGVQVDYTAVGDEWNDRQGAEGAANHARELLAIPESPPHCGIS